MKGDRRAQLEIYNRYYHAMYNTALRIVKDSTEAEDIMQESFLSAFTKLHTFKGDKINVAAIGNLVPQLHVHHVVRYRSDRAWPAPVWGKFPAVAYTDGAVADIRQRIGAAALRDFAICGQV